MNIDNEITKVILKRKLKEYLEEKTTKSSGKNMYVCPLCGSGTGKHKTGAFSVFGDNEELYNCFSCGEKGDIFTLVGKLEGISDFKEQFEFLKNKYNIGDFKPAKTKKEDVKPEEKDYTSYFQEVNKNLTKFDYLKKRGISDELANKYNIGYVENWQLNGKGPVSPRLIIPTSKYSYLARDIRSNTPRYEERYTKLKVGPAHIFNFDTAMKRAEEDKKPIFIVEGEIDALSVLEVGKNAIGLGSTSNFNILLNELKNYNGNKEDIVFIISLDQDEAGQKAITKVENILKELNLTYGISKMCKYQDPNTHLVLNKEDFINYLTQEEQYLEHNIKNEIEEEKEDYYNLSVGAGLQDFINGITQRANTRHTPTGFRVLDAILDGGLYEGLYIIGAISSLGKTTLITQMCDQMAAAGNHILFFSMEMAKNEIIAKSISKHTIKRVLDNKLDVSLAKTCRGITNADNYKFYSTTEKQLIIDATIDYSKYAKNIFIYEGIGDIGVEQIRAAVEKHIKLTGVTPIVVIDYLQIIAPYNERMTDKQNTDKNVLELKRISRDYKATIFGISSFNRENYSNEASMKAFKESGAIEYSSDVLFGLQLKGTGDKDFNVDLAKNKNPREIELKILKNRNGVTGLRVDFKYYPMFNYFVESSF